MSDKKVKGTVLLDQVRMIRGNRDKDWNQYLKPEDWQIINGRILPSVWYPLELYQRCGWAVFKLIAGGNLDLVRAYGRIRGKELFGDIYKAVILSQDPEKALERYNIISTQMYNFLKIKSEKVGEKHLQVTISYDRNDQTYEVHIYQVWGQFEQLLEMAGGKNVKVALIAREWKGDPNTIFDIRWE
jgi:hypothetical protein